MSWEAFIAFTISLGLCLEKVEKIMGHMHWEIKNIIDINKMEQL